MHGPWLLLTTLGTQASELLARHLPWLILTVSELTPRAYVGNAFENQFCLSSLVLGEQTRSVTHSVRPEPHLNLFPDYM